MDVDQGLRQTLAVHGASRPDRVGWPSRTRRLIEETHALCIEWLASPLQACMVEVEQRLYTQAERSRNAQEQQHCLHIRLMLQQQRSMLERQVMENVRQQFSQLGNAPAATPDKPLAPASRRPLALLDQLEHEQTVVVEKIAARAEGRNGTVLFELGYRFAVLVGQPPLEGEALPPGPHALTRAFRDACNLLDLGLEQHLLMLQCFDSVVVQALPSLYEALNEHLGEDGILPQLRPLSVQPRLQERPRTPADLLRQPTANVPATSTTNDVVAAASGEQGAVLDSLRDMLAQHRGTRAIPANNARVASSEEVQLALDALQLQSADPDAPQRSGLLDARSLQTELLHQLNAGKPAGTPPAQLNAEQGDTVELVAMLFEQMGQQIQRGGNTHTLLSDLQLPLLRMAVTDRGFFNQTEHPARKLLGTVADAASDWLDGPDGADRTLAAKLNQLVERSRREPPSIGLYNSMLADVEHHVGLLARKAQIAERRQVEAMQGRERLEQARQRAAALMAERFEQHNPHGLLRTLLERAWTDVLALTVLRHGEASDEFAARLCITDQLLGQLPVDDRAKLQADVENGLQQIGMHAEEAVQVAQRLLPDASAVVSADSAAATDLVEKLRQHQRLGEREASTTPTEAKPAEPAGSLALEAMVDIFHKRLRQMPFGSWFEFTDPANGEVTQRKLAWYSPVSGHSLFVTRRGLRSEEMNLRQLAREMAEGRAREMTAVRENLFDRAWQALVGRLRQITGSKQSATRTSATESA